MAESGFHVYVPLLSISALRAIPSLYMHTRVSRPLSLCTWAPVALHPPVFPFLADTILSQNHLKAALKHSLTILER